MSFVSLVKHIVRNPLERRSIPVVIVSFFGAFFLLNRLQNAVCEVRLPFPCVPAWPISLFHLRVPPVFDYPNALHLLVATATFGLFLLSIFVLPRLHFHPVVIALLAVALILGTTLTHGWQAGLVQAGAGVGDFPNDYYRDALNIDTPVRFLQNFEQAQPSLSIHGRTHPPGAILLFYALQQLLTPAWIAIAIAVFATWLTAFFLYKILSFEFTPSGAGQVLFIFFLIPSIQVYFAASLDAVVAPLIIGTFFWFFSTSRWAPWISVVCLISASFLNFGVLFVFPVLVLLELLQFSGLRRSLLLIGVLVLFYIVLYALVGFNYLDSFRIATQIENPGGFQLLADPVTYLMTRIEDVAEVLLFLGPFLTILMANSLIERKAHGMLMRFSILGMATFLLMILTGAYQTGETARAAIFLYPFLMIPAGFRIAEMQAQGTSYRRLAVLVFLQTVVMQLIGDYWW
jgi:hypothetical protein